MKARNTLRHFSSHQLRPDVKISKCISNARTFSGHRILEHWQSLSICLEFSINLSFYIINECDSLWSYGLQSTRLVCPWDFPHKNTGVGCHFLLQCMKVKSKVKSLSRVQLLATPWTAAHQAPLSMGFSRQEYWSGLPLPSLITYYQMSVWPRKKR